jgi:hypothetical protein
MSEISDEEVDYGSFESSVNPSTEFRSLMEYI